ncbi:MAG: ATP-binding protein, partial [Runella zeae]
FGPVKRDYYDDYDYKLKAIYNQDNDKVLKVEISRNELDIDALENRYAEVFEFEMMKNSPYKLEDFKKDKIELNIPIEKLISEKIDRNLLNRVGKFGFTFYFLKNNISDDKEDGDLKKYPYKSINSANRKSWLKKFGGIKIFRDDFRIRPYGENGDDWLRLGERQAQSPGGAGQRLGGYRIRPNQIAGTIRISRLYNESFQDKSGREGIIENDEFELFKNILLEIISLFEKDRNVTMYNLSEFHKKNNEEAEKLRKAKEEAKRIRKGKEEREEKKTSSENQSENNSSGDNPEYSETAENMADAILILEKESEKKDEEISLLRNLASSGLIISSFAHELNNLQQRLRPRTEFLKIELLKHLSEDNFKNINKYDNPFYLLELIKQEDLKLWGWLDYSLKTLKRDKRERRDINLNTYFENFQANWLNVLKERQINIELVRSENMECSLRAFEIDLDSIFNNLLSNSINSFKESDRDKKEIQINFKCIDDDIKIEFRDNGKGLNEKYKHDNNLIFNLF